MVNLPALGKFIVRFHFLILTINLVGCASTSVDFGKKDSNASMRTPAANNTVIFEGNSYSIPQDSFNDAYAKCTNKGYSDCYPGPKDQMSDWSANCKDTTGIIVGAQMSCFVSGKIKLNNKKIFWGKNSNPAIDSFSDAYIQCIKNGMECNMMSLDNSNWRKYCVDSSSFFGGASFRCYIEGTAVNP